MAPVTKEKGKKPAVIAPPPDTSNVIDLMEALKRSLGKKGAVPPPKQPAASGGVHKRRAKA